MDKAVYPIELTVPLSHPRLKEFCTTLRCAGDPILVPLAERLRPIENCYWNVLAQVEKRGGEILFGWLLKHWPGLYLAAEHHAVWRRPDGILFDVTERRLEVVEPTTFALDSIQDIQLDAAPNIHMEYFRLTNDHRVIELIDLSARLNSAAESVNCFIANELGQSCEMQLAIARGVAPNRVQVTGEQRKRYERLVRTATELRLEIGDVINSLVSRPPNRAARAATRAFARHHWAGA